MKKSIFKKIYFLFWTIFSLCILIGSFLFINQIQNTLKEEKEKSLNTLKITNQSITDELSKLAMSNYLISHNKSLERFEIDSAIENPDTAYKSFYQQNFEDFVQEESFFNKLENSIEIYFPQLNKSISTSSSYLMQTQKKSFNFNHWILESTNGEDALSYYNNNLNSRGFHSSKDLAYIIRISTSPLHLLSQYSTSSDGLAMIIDSNHVYDYGFFGDEKNEFYRNQKRIFQNTSPFISFQKGNLFLISTLTNSSTNFKLASVKKINYIFRNLILSIALFSGTLCFLAILFFNVLFLIRKNIHQPLRIVTKGLNEFQKGNYTYKITEANDNEYQYIFDSFNTLGKKIDQLIQDVLDEQSRTKDAEIRQLQLQLDPHFLYNSLSFIISAAKLDKKESVIEMCYSLSDYYRYILSKKGGTNTLASELDAIEIYLKIFQMRSRRLNYTINVDEKLFTQPFLPLLLQPIIENSIKYGIDYSDNILEIAINGKLDGHLYTLSVRDNGKLMSEEEIQFINNQILTGHDLQHLGLYNIVQRLKYRYGTDSKITFEKNSSHGVCVNITLPIETEV